MQGVLITGAKRGIGLELAKRYAAGSRLGLRNGNLHAQLVEFLEIEPIEVSRCRVQSPY